MQNVFLQKAGLLANTAVHNYRGKGRGEFWFRFFVGKMNSFVVNSTPTRAQAGRPGGTRETSRRLTLRVHTQLGAVGGGDHAALNNRATIRRCTLPHTIIQYTASVYCTRNSNRNRHMESVMTVVSTASPAWTKMVDSPYHTTPHNIFNFRENSQGDRG